MVRIHPSQPTKLYNISLPFSNDFVYNATLTGDYYDDQSIRKILCNSKVTVYIGDMTVLKAEYHIDLSLTIRRKSLSMDMCGLS